MTDDSTTTEAGEAALPVKPGGVDEGALGRSVLHTERAPQPRSSFSQGIRAGDLVQISGQGPLDVETGEVLFVGDIEAQTTKTLDTIEAVLAADATSFGSVVMLRVYLTDRMHFEGMNRAYESFMARRFPAGDVPARTTVVVGLPLPDMLVEIDALAVHAAPWS